MLVSAKKHLYLIVASLVSTVGHAQDSEIVEKRIANIDTQTNKIQKKAFARTEYFAVKNGNANITGSALAVGIYFARDHKSSMGPRFHQSYASQSNWSTLYTALNFDFTYAITGMLSRDTVKTELNGWDVLRYTQYNPGGLRLRFSLDQYYYNTSSGAIPLSGFGLETSYELPSNYDISVEFGVGVDRITNPRATLTPFRAFFMVQDSF